jgi:hypothetical protein
MAEHIKIDDIAPRVVYTVGGTPQTVFAVPFPFFDNTNLVVSVGGVVKLLTTDYTVTGAGLSAGGSVTLIAAAQNTIVVILRATILERVTDFPKSGPLDPDGLNTDLDRFVAMLQERETAADRFLRLPEDEAVLPPPDLPSASARANKAASFDAQGNLTAGASVASTIVSAAMIPVVTAATIDIAKAALSLRKSITAATTFHLNPAGSDLTGDGSVGLPWRNPQHAWDTVQRLYQLDGGTVKIKFADGTYEGVTMNGPLIGQRAPTDLAFEGNLVSRDNVIIHALNSPTQYCFGGAFGAKAQIHGFKAQRTIVDVPPGTASVGQDLFTAGSDVHFYVGNVTFGDIVNEWVDFSIYDGAKVYIDGSYGITKGGVSVIVTSTAGSPVLTGVSSFVGVHRWQGIGGLPHIPLGTFITDYNAGAGTITMSKNAIGTAVHTISLHNGGACHMSVGRGGLLAYLTNGIPGHITVTLSGTPAYLEPFMLANGGRIDCQAVQWNGPALGKPVGVRANGVLDGFREGVFGLNAFPGATVWTDAASFTAGDETITLGVGIADIQKDMFINGFVPVSATLTASSNLVTLSTTAGVDFIGNKLSGLGIPSGADIIGNLGGGVVQISYPATISGAVSARVTGSGIGNGTRIRKRVGNVLTLDRPAQSTQVGIGIAVGGEAMSGGQFM